MLNASANRWGQLAFDYREDHAPTLDYEPRREAAMVAYAKS
jgi:hypothetical protein